MDHLSLLLQRVCLNAGVFYSGQICGVHDFPRDTERSHVHLINRGPVELVGAAGGGFAITQPSLLFLPRPDAHRLIADERLGADVVCASIEFAGGLQNPIVDSLPAMVLVPLAELPAAEPLLALLYREAFAGLSGRQAALDRLCELLLIQLLRHCIDNRLTDGGTLSGLADPRLSKALAALHGDPARPWKLGEMAALAGMSRARFASHFRAVTGATPADHLTSWRIVVAQQLLKAGRPLKHVVTDVGYGSASAFARAFLRKVGKSPTHWLHEATATGR
ncbi:MAG: AraC family transcriptional regulator [Ramlibacter sp.]